MGHRNLSRLTTAAVLCLLASCMQLQGPMDDLDEGELTIRVADETAKIIEPPIDMTIASYDVFGTGPNGASFFRNFTGSSITLKGLVSGNWAIEVDGKNPAGTIVSHGEGNVRVETGSARTLDIVTAAAAGTGSLSLAVTWIPAGVDAPSIECKLTATQGLPMDLEFTIVSPGRATYSNAAIEKGYYTLVVKLLDNGQLVMGAVDIVRIVKGQTTSGTIDFPDVNTGTGSISVGITPQMNNPVPVTLNGQKAELAAGQPMTVTASVPPDLGNATCVWYVNGVSAGTGSSITLNGTGSSLSPRTYRLDVSVFVLNGSRGGSATCTFTVYGTTQVTLEWDPNSETDLAGYRMYVGTSSGVYGAPVDVGLTTTYTVTNLLGKHTYYFAATAYNAGGMESGRSNEVAYTTP
jgi:hypothetical protein